MEKIMRTKTSTALAALILGVTLCRHAIAQDQVQVFDEAPSLDQLRAILIPDAGPGQSRKIEIPRQDMNPITPTSAALPAPTPAPTPAPALAAAPQPAAPIQATAMEHTAQPGAAAMPKHVPAKPAAMPVPDHHGANAVAFRINFAMASDAIPPSYRPHLDSIVDLMKEEPKLALTIEGHTDARGNADYNMELSRRRAISVMRYLIGHGVDSTRLVAIGKGKTAPLTANPFDAENRRVQFVSTGQSGT
jgi:outer membrane protein OmpA-like peptidoglycan-associated protein